MEKTFAQRLLAGGFKNFGRGSDMTGSERLLIGNRGLIANPFDAKGKGVIAYGSVGGKRADKSLYIAGLVARVWGKVAGGVGVREVSNLICFYWRQK